jgi:hypothetical protein
MHQKTWRWRGIGLTYAAMRSTLSPELLAPVAALLAACTLSAWVLWSDYKLFGTPGKPIEPLPPTVNVEAEATLPAPARETLTARALFGDADAPDQAEGLERDGRQSVPDADALPASTATYQLFGVIDSPRETARRAVIGTGEADQQELAVGAAAPDGATVRAILRRLVVLERNGTLEKLELPSPALDAGSITLPPPALPTQPVWSPPPELPDDAYTSD